MTTVMVFGASGLLGSSLVPALQACGYNVITQSRSSGTDVSLNPSVKSEVAAVLDAYRPAAVVNLIAATSVDQCELHPDLAWEANAGVVAVIADSIVDQNDDPKLRPHLVHVSTDQVYDGMGPHAEKKVSPINVYGLSKITGELLAERVGATVLRTNFYGRSRCKGRVSFSDWLVRSMRERIPITVFDDIKFSAIHIDTLCSIISRSIEYRVPGVFNAGCRDGVSKAHFAMALAKALSLPTDHVSVGSSTSLSLKARRPIDMTMNVALLESTLRIKCPNMLEEIEHTAKEYLNG